MKKTEPVDPNDPLSEMLRAWKVSAPLPPRFEERVWNRIARAEAAAKVTLWTQFRGFLERALPRPVMPASYLMLLLLAGVGTGYWRGQEKAAHLRHEMGTLYVQSVDPYQALGARK